MSASVDKERNIENIACLGKTMSLCIKQHLSNIWDSIYEKVKLHWGWVKKKTLLIKKACVQFDRIWSKDIWVSFRIPVSRTEIRDWGGFTTWVFTRVSFRIPSSCTEVWDQGGLTTWVSTVLPIFSGGGT